jgi:hypothetical protein
VTALLNRTTSASRQWLVALVQQTWEGEVYWQEQLRGFIENGGNAHCRRKEKNNVGTPFETNM